MLAYRAVKTQLAAEALFCNVILFAIQRLHVVDNLNVYTTALVCARFSYGRGCLSYIDVRLQLSRAT